jgi:hypothetical protein
MKEEKDIYDNKRQVLVAGNELNNTNIRGALLEALGEELSDSILDITLDPSYSFATLSIASEAVYNILIEDGIIDTIHLVIFPSFIVVLYYYILLYSHNKA